MMGFLEQVTPRRHIGVVPKHVDESSFLQGDQIMASTMAMAFSRNRRNMLMSLPSPTRPSKCQKIVERQRNGGQ